MGFFSKAEDLSSEKYGELAGKIAALNSRMDALETNMNSLRGLINRKMGGSSKNSDDLLSVAEVKDLLSQFGIVWDGNTPKD